MAEKSPSEESGPDLFSDPNRATEPPGKPGFSGGLHRRLKPTIAPIGRGPIPPDSRKYRFDTLRAVAGRVAFSVTKDDRMSAREAGNMLHEIHNMFGIAKEDESFLQSFNNSLFLYHTLNSASVLQPGRGFVMVADSQFDAYEVVVKLGVNARRFYRAFADDIKETNLMVLAQYDPYDPVKAELHGQILQVATERGIQRFPHLCHDSADACIVLSPAERAAIIQSKAFVLSGTPNTADKAPVRAEAAVESVAE